MVVIVVALNVHFYYASLRPFCLGALNSASTMGYCEELPPTAVHWLERGICACFTQ